MNPMLRIGICDLMWKDDSGKEWGLEKTLQDLSEIKDKEWAFELLKRIIPSIYVSDKLAREIVARVRESQEARMP